MKTVSNFFLIFLFVASGYAQNVTLLKDINPGDNSSFTFEDNRVVELNGNIYFSADDGTNGAELWIYDGIEVFLIKDINPGSGNSDCSNFQLVNDKIIFVADDGVHGREWWTTDGTAEGTELLVDIIPGSENGVFVNSFGGNNFFTFANRVYFAGASVRNNYELWTTDGTAEGTQLVKNLASDTPFTTSSYPSDFVSYGGVVYFLSDVGFWKTNGSTSGTTLVTDQDPDNVFGFDPVELFAADSYMLLIQDDNLWRSSGSASGTRKIMDLERVNLNWSGNRFTQVGDKVLFPGNDGVSGDELWSTDGTTEGTEMVIDLWPGTNGYAPQNTVVFKGELYFKGDNGETGIEFYKSDGTASGTQLVKDINSGSNAGFSLPTEITANDTQIFMNAGGSFRQELWVSNGSEEGTMEIDIDPNGESRPISLIPFGEKLFLFAQTSELGYEPYVVDFNSSATFDQFGKNNIIVFPNPASDILTIETSDLLDFEVTIYDLSGKPLVQQKNNNVLQVAQLPAGNYFVKIVDLSTNLFSINKVVIN